MGQGTIFLHRGLSQQQDGRLFSTYFFVKLDGGHNGVMFVVGRFLRAQRNGVQHTRGGCFRYSSGLPMAEYRIGGVPSG